MPAQRRLLLVVATRAPCVAASSDCSLRSKQVVSGGLDRRGEVLLSRRAALRRAPDRTVAADPRRIDRRRGPDCCCGRSVGRSFATRRSAPGPWSPSSSAAVAPRFSYWIRFLGLSLVHGKSQRPVATARPPLLVQPGASVGTVRAAAVSGLRERCLCRRACWSSGIEQHVSHGVTVSQGCGSWCCRACCVGWLDLSRSCAFCHSGER
jgi:hypothetical protein